MSGGEGDIMGAFVAKLSDTYADRGGVACADLLGDEGLLSPDALMSELAFSMLMWEASVDQAVKAANQLREQLIDLNELRVCTPEELASMIGLRYPKSAERCQRLIGALNTVYERENTVALASLREKNKREVQEYFAGIDGIPPYVLGRLILLGLGWHAFPLDDRLNKLLVSRDIAESGLGLAAQTQRLERMVRASDALSTYTLIEQWAQAQRTPKSGGGSSRVSAKGAS